MSARRRASRSRSRDNPRLRADPASLPEITAPNLRELLREGGAKALTSWVKDQKKLLITDTTFRDAHQSLLATRVRTRDLTAIAEPTAHILQDAFSLEVWGGATFDTCYRFLHESPWERLDQLRQAIPNIPFQMLVRGINGVGYHAYPDNVIREFIREAARSGIDIFRVFDSLQLDPESMRRLAIEAVLKEPGKLRRGHRLLHRRHPRLPSATSTRSTTIVEAAPRQLERHAARTRSASRTWPASCKPCWLPRSS